ncbi:low-density lipoprotein receptor-related protein 3 [Trichonephila clavipes]|nr:low-density lipoprotein receptor-related protein 3 [Trichonephila clavipes]
MKIHSSLSEPLYYFVLTDNSSPSQYGGYDPRLVAEWVRFRVKASAKDPVRNNGGPSTQNLTDSFKSFVNVVQISSSIRTEPTTRKYCPRGLDHDHSVNKAQSIFIYLSNDRAWLFDHLTPNFPVPTDDVIIRIFIESSTLEQVVAIHSSMAAELAGLVSNHAKPVEVYSQKVMSGS